jgi:uncharacterized membrane-anchored protein
MDRSFCGEYDNYNYRPVEEMTLEEQLESAKKSYDAVMRLSQREKNAYLDEMIIRIKQRIQLLEQQNKENQQG